MNEPQPTYHAYLLRLWRNDSRSPWRASLENPQTGHRRHFSSLESLGRFLLEETGAAQTAEPGNRRDET